MSVFGFIIKKQHNITILVIMILHVPPTEKKVIYPTKPHSYTHNIPTNNIHVYYAFIHLFFPHLILREHKRMKKGNE